MNSQRNIPIGPAWVFSLAKGWAQTVRYLLIDTAAAGIVTGTYFLSQFFPFNKGVPIATLEVLSSLSVLMFLLVNPKLLNNRALKILFLVFSFLLIGDLFYAYFYYWKEIGTPTRFSILVHEIPLSLSYFLLSVFYLYCMRRSYREIFFHPFCVVPLLVTLPVMARFVFPLTNPVATTMDPLIQGLEIFSLLCTFVGLVLSIVVFTFAKPLFWSVFSLGMTTSYLAGLGIRIDRLSGANVQFNNFESLWAFGNLVAVIAILSFSERGQDITYKKERSIILSARMLGIMVAFASSVILSVTHWKELGVMQTIIFTSLVSVHLAGALAHFLWDRLVEFSAAVEKLFKSDVVASVPHSHNPNGIPIEMAELYSQTLRARVLDYKSAIELKQQVEISKQIGATARQVAHDIRSPLAALDAILKHIPELPENKRIVVRSAASRIRDIANKLLSDRNPNYCTPLLLCGAVEQIVTEARYQYRSRLNLRIETNFGIGAYGIFLKAPVGEYKEILSNLINNAADAILDKGQIEIVVKSEEENAVIQVKDTGHGISQDILPKLGAEGFSSGKPGGIGIGLYLAKKNIETWGGSLRIESKVGEGTTATLSLPKAETPSWFIPSIDLSGFDSVMILDDDKSIHQVWDSRLEPFVAKVAVKHFSGMNDLLRDYQGVVGSGGKVLLLVDYEVAGEKRTGIDLVTSLGAGENSLIVTSHHEESTVIAECIAAKTKLLPKDMAAFVPIVFQKRNIPSEMVLIDDDILLQEAWAIFLASRGKKVHGFIRVGDFLNSPAAAKKSIPIYVDYNLGDDSISGLEVTRLLSNQGYRNLYLSTGKEPSEVPHAPWLLGIVGKNPPLLEKPSEKESSDV